MYKKQTPLLLTATIKIRKKNTKKIPIIQYNINKFLRNNDSAQPTKNYQKQKYAFATNNAQKKKKLPEIAPPSHRPSLGGNPAERRNAVVNRHKTVRRHDVTLCQG